MNSPCCLLGETPKLRWAFAHWHSTIDAVGDILAVSFLFESPGTQRPQRGESVG